MTYTATAIKNIRWQCITCNNIVADEAFEQLPKDEQNVPFGVTDGIQVWYNRRSG